MPALPISQACCWWRVCDQSDELKNVKALYSLVAKIKTQGHTAEAPISVPYQQCDLERDTDLLCASVPICVTWG